MTLSVRLARRFPGFALDVDFTAPPGVTAIFGRSGSGKTTIINAVAGLIRPDAGHVALDGRTLFDHDRRVFLPPWRRRIGYVFQEARLFPHLSVRQNLTYGRWFTGRRGGAGVDQVTELLGLAHLLGRGTAGLSGGERQRVAIGRALLSDPRLLLMDEPLAALDDTRKDDILPYLERLRDETRVPIIYVSHNIGEVARLATTIVLVDQGRITGAGPAAAILADPGAAQAVGLRDAGAILPARVAAQDADGLTCLHASAGPLWVPRIDRPVGTRLRLRIAAQDVILSRDRPAGLSALNILPVTVTAVRQGDGPGAIAQLRAGDDLLLVRLTRRSAEALGLAEGLACHAILKAVAIAPSDVIAAPDGGEAGTWSGGAG